jgi:lycopene beta-cyclase
MAYGSVTSERLDSVVRATNASRDWLLDTRVAAVGPEVLRLEDGRELRARVVIDARGQVRSDHLDLRWQKFVGQEVELEAEHGLSEPIIMDATVPQLDGYRFVYVLPLTARTLLIEDTYYSDGADLGPDALRARIADYAAGKGWRIVRVIREEAGILPVALGGDIGAFWDEGEPGMPRIGLRAALFHPTTGYSFPDAVRAADLIAGLDRLDAAGVHAAVRRASETLWRERWYYRALNRMLFLAADPAERYRVLERFYGLDEALIARFYAGRSTAADKLRIVAGKPPVPVGRALRALVA